MNSVFKFHRKFIPTDRSWRKWLSNRERCLRVLCQAGANVCNPLIYLPLLPLEYAITMGPESGLFVAGVLLDHGADINKGNQEGLPPLARAIIRCNVKMVRYLLECGAMVQHGTGLNYFNGVLSTFAFPGFRGIFYFERGVEILKVG